MGSELMQVGVVVGMTLFVMASGFWLGMIFERTRRDWQDTFRRTEGGAGDGRRD